MLLDTCDRCKFRGIVGEGREDEYFCYRFPPALGTKTGTSGRWPLVSNKDACGEFQATTPNGDPLG